MNTRLTQPVMNKHLQLPSVIRELVKWKCIWHLKHGSVTGVIHYGPMWRTPTQKVPPVKQKCMCVRRTYIDIGIIMV